MITDVPGVTVGDHTDTERATGCTVVLLPEGTVGAYALTGAAPGTRETDILRPHTIETEVHAFVLSGGSAFGLACVDGVVAELEDRGVGFRFGDAKARPSAHDARAAVRAARTSMEEGSVGAGTGATVGKWAGPEHRMKGGLGTASVHVGDTGVIVGALAVCNAGGDVVDEHGAVMAGARARDVAPAWASMAGQSTVLSCVVTNAKLDKATATHVAWMASAGVARTVRPAFTFYDGDVVFCGATGAVDCEPTLVGAAGAEAVAEAIRRGVRAARSLGGVPGLAG